MKADVVIPTYKPDERFFKLVDMLLNDMQGYVNRIIVMNTDKAEWDKAVPEGFEEAHKKEVGVFHIEKERFDHAGTRHEGMLKCVTPYVLFMTQDALPKDNTLMEKLVAALNSDGDVAVAYARQLPNEDCNVLERLTRGFNYPAESRVKTKDDIETLGIKTFFCSNVCAMYRRLTYDKLGGFSAPAIFNEDMVYAGHAIKAGLKIAYVGDAEVYHSHNYSGIRQFHRNFDLGVSQTDHPEVFEGIKSETEGKKMVKRNAATLFKSGHPLAVIKLVWQSGWKYLGYKKGRAYKSLSMDKVMKYTDNVNYWTAKNIFF